MHVDDFVWREVICNVGLMMYQVGKDIETASKLFDEDSEDILNLFSKPDFESAAREAGWLVHGNHVYRHDPEGCDDEDTTGIFADSWQDACEIDQLDVDYLEAYEHYVVSPFLAAELKAEGEIVGEFAGLTIWGRCTTGQMISMDYIIQKVFKQVMERK